MQSFKKNNPLLATMPIFTKLLFIFFIFSIFTAHIKDESFCPHGGTFPSPINQSIDYLVGVCSFNCRLARCSASCRIRSIRCSVDDFRGKSFGLQRTNCCLSSNRTRPWLGMIGLIGSMADRLVLSKNGLKWNHFCVRTWNQNGRLLLSTRAHLFSSL